MSVISPCFAIKSTLCDNLLLQIRHKDTRILTTNIEMNLKHCEWFPVCFRTRLVEIFWSGSPHFRSLNSWRFVLWWLDLNLMTICYCLLLKQSEEGRSLPNHAWDMWLPQCPGGFRDASVYKLTSMVPWQHTHTHTHSLTHSHSHTHTLTHTHTHTHTMPWWI